MKTYKEIITEWVRQNFGDNEADDPSWNIEALAKYISEQDIKPDELNANTKSNVFCDLEQHYLEEDVEQYANDQGIKLTPQQIYNVADKIRFSDWYCSIDAESMDYYIKRELEK